MWISSLVEGQKNKHCARLCYRQSEFKEIHNKYKTIFYFSVANVGIMKVCACVCACDYVKCIDSPVFTPMFLPL